MKIFLLISMLIFTPFSLASYHGESSSGEASTGGSSNGGYGGGGAIAGILLVVGLVYFLNRDTDTDEVANELLSQNTKKLKNTFQKKEQIYSTLLLVLFNMMNIYLIQKILIKDIVLIFQRLRSRKQEGKLKKKESIIVKIF